VEKDEREVPSSFVTVMKEGEEKNHHHPKGGREKGFLPVRIKIDEGLRQESWKVSALLRKSPDTPGAPPPPRTDEKVREGNRINCRLETDKIELKYKSQNWFKIGVRRR